jgi:hypothetical protein
VAVIVAAGSLFSYIETYRAHEGLQRRVTIRLRSSAVTGPYAPVVATLTFLKNPQFDDDNQLVRFAARSGVRDELVSRVSEKIASRAG